MDTTETPRALLALDDDEMVGRLTESFTGNGLAVCARASTAETAIEGATREKPDACVVDAALPGSGLVAASGIKQRVPNIGIIVLGQSDEGHDVLDAIAAGARGYAVKPCDPELLAEDVHRLLRGEYSLDDEFMGRVLDELEARERRLEARRRMRQILTEREAEVLELVRRGLSTREVSDALYVAPVTVRSHLSAIIRKLGVDDREAAVDFFEPW